MMGKKKKSITMRERERERNLFTIDGLEARSSWKRWWWSPGLRMRMGKWRRRRKWSTRRGSVKVLVLRLLLGMGGCSHFTVSVSVSVSASLLHCVKCESVIDWIEKLRVRVFSLYLFYIGLFSMFVFVISVGLINGLLLFLLGLDGLFHSFFF